MCASAGEFTSRGWFGHGLKECLFLKPDRRIFNFFVSQTGLATATILLDWQARTIFISRDIHKLFLIMNVCLKFCEAIIIIIIIL